MELIAKVGPELPIGGDGVGREADVGVEDEGGARHGGLGSSGSGMASLADGVDVDRSVVTAFFCRVRRFL